MLRSITLYITLLILLPGVAQSQEISVAVVGDMMFGPEVSKIMDREGSLAPFTGVLEHLKNADITYGILEGGIGTRGEAVQDKEHTFRSKPSSARGLSNAGFDILSVANPHIMDYGVEGFKDTLEFLSWYGVKYVGGGMIAEEARKPVVLKAKDKKVAFLAYYKGNEFVPAFAKQSKPGPVSPVYGEFEQDVAAAKEQADFVIASIHWGIQPEGTGITRRQKLFSQKLIDSGADVVLNQWLHTLQGIEIYKGKPIVHSLGDFIYGTYAKQLPIGFILKFAFSTESLSRIDITPVSTSNTKTASYFPVVLKKQEAQDALTILVNISSELGTNIEIKDDIGIINFAE